MSTKALHTALDFGSDLAHVTAPRRSILARIAKSLRATREAFAFARELELLTKSGVKPDKAFQLALKRHPLSL